MAKTVDCSRCHKTRAALSTAPLPGELGDEIATRVCSPCWEEWKEQEVRVINELRLNFMDPHSNDVLERHLKKFLGLVPKTGEGTQEVPERSPLDPN